MGITIRSEAPADIAAIETLIEAAFCNAAHTSHTEQFIVNALRTAERLTISLVAECNDTIIGHVAVSPVTLSDGTDNWYGLGPISVAPDFQRQGIGSQLMNQALAALSKLRAGGCVVLGEPDFYGRFGFKAEPTLVLPGVPAEYFQAITFSGPPPTGSVSYHQAFNAKA